MAELKQNPQIRFAGFKEAWERRKLGDVADIIGGGTPSTRIKEYWCGDVDWYAPAEIGEQIYLTGSQKKITELGLQNSSAKMLPIGTVLFTSRAGIGNTAILAKTAATNQGFQSIVPHKDSLDSYFIFSRTQELKRYGETVGAGSTFVEVTGKQITAMPIKVPGIPEQKKIAAFFAALDTIITLHQREYKKTLNFKKAMLEKMFPKDGADRPEIRFAGFTDAWEQRKLGDIIEDYIEKTIVQNQYPVLTSSQQKGIILQEDYFAGRQATTDENIGYFVLPKGYFTYRSRSDNNIFIINRNDLIYKGIISYFYPVFRVKEADSDFFLRRVNNGIQRQITMAAEGTGQHVLSLNKFKSIVTLFPLIDEQRQIGAFFASLDRLITLHQRELKKLQSLKKSLLEKMFV